MSVHIGAKPGEIAERVLLPGDPMRAKWIAETFLEGARCYTEVRGMLGFTGTWHGHPVSVQGSGMGQPSMAIYVNELFREYDVASVIRVGSCGGLSDRVALRDVVIASGACTDSSMNRITFEGLVAERKLAHEDIDLGTIARSRLTDAKIADAVFGLAEGATSGAVQGTLTNVIVKVTKVVTPQDVVRAELLKITRLRMTRQLSL